MEHYLLRPAGSNVLLLGNEIIARAALESGICVATAYPGTPSTEIVEVLASVAKKSGIYVEWSVNEKVAFETAYAAAISGVRALTSMKHVGLNVAADILMSSSYSGVNEGFVIVSADDPGQHSSQNEQDNRWYGLLSHIPVIEPSSPRDV
ncbi:MAG: indolepyruvate ferredoxin oxidoreductase subunit alpha, partial [Desulfurococcaceae archaeon]